MLSETKLKFLKDYNYQNVLLVQKVWSLQLHKPIEKKSPDVMSTFVINEGFKFTKINSCEINCKNKNNLRKWASFFEQIFQKNEVLNLILSFY